MDKWTAVLVLALSFFGFIAAMRLKREGLQLLFMVLAVLVAMEACNELGFRSSADPFWQ